MRLQYYKPNKITRVSFVLILKAVVNRNLLLFLFSAIEQRGTNPDEDFWDDANLICPKDGCRIQDMDALQRCVTKNGHNIFYLVGPNAPTFSDISLDIEWMAELYEDLTRDTTKMDQKLRLWTRTRLRETEVRS